MRPLRWLVLASAVPAGGGLGGVVRYTTELTAALARRDDVEVSVFGDRHAAATLAGLTGAGDRVRTPRVALPAALAALAERHHPATRARGFDVVQGTKHVVNARSRALRLLTVHDLLLLDRPADFPALKRALLPGPYRRSLREADLLVAVSAATRRRLVELLPGAADRSVAVPLAAAGSLLAADPAPVPGLRGRRFVLVVGDASPRKNLATVVRAWAAVSPYAPDAVLAIAGPADWSRSPADAERTRLTGSGAVLALGHISDAQLRWCYEHAALVLCPSLVEGYGLPVAEALAFGAPVLVSADPALVEAAGGRAVDVVPALDAGVWAARVGAVLRGPDLRRGAPGDVRSWDDVAAETVDAAREALRRRASGRLSAVGAGP